MLGDVGQGGWGVLSVEAVSEYKCNNLDEG